MAVVIGMFICLLVLLISADCYVLCKNFGDACLDETTYAYMYTYKYPTEDVLEDGTPAYVESLKKEAYGYNLDVTVLGIDKDNPYFPVETSNKKNEIVISSAAAQKFGVKVGDKLVLSDEVNERDYAFTVKDIVHFASGVYVFLDRDAMQELFDQEDDYYNVVFADHALDIDNGRLYSTVSRENVEESSQIFTDMMGPMVSMMAAISALIFMIVILHFPDESTRLPKGRDPQTVSGRELLYYNVGSIVGSTVGKMVHGSDLPVFYFQCSHRNGFTVPAAVVRHDLRRHPDLLSGDQLPAGGQTEQAGACGSIEE